MNIVIGLVVGVILGVLVGIINGVKVTEKAFVKTERARYNPTTKNFELKINGFWQLGDKY